MNATAASYSNRSNAARAARSAGITNFNVAKLDDTGRFKIEMIGEDFAPVAVDIVAEANDAAPAAPAVAVIALATETSDIGIVPADTAAAEAEAYANENGVAVTMRDPVSDELIHTVHPAPAPKKVKRQPKVTREAAEPQAAKSQTSERRTRKEAPTGMVTRIIELALRPEGVTPAELNELTQWKGAPWKWLFANPKQTGYADRWGYDFAATKNGHAATYRLTAKVAAVAA